jgi:hypothetical protein
MKERRLLFFGLFLYIDLQISESYENDELYIYTYFKFSRGIKNTQNFYAESASVEKVSKSYLKSYKPVTLTNSSKSLKASFYLCIFDNNLFW